MWNSPRALVGVLLSGLAALTACSGGGSTPQPTPSVTTAPADQLARLASAGLSAYYTATYTLLPKGSEGGTVTIRRTPSAYRVDITTKGSDAILLRNRLGTYSCDQQPKKRATCFYVARAGKPIPPTFDAGVQKVFGTYLTAFSTSARTYNVVAIAPRPAQAGLPVGDCFYVRPLPASPKPPVAAGDYCFAANGIPLHVRFPSGMLDITSIALETPAPGLLVPPAEATPIPGA